MQRVKILGAFPSLAIPYSVRVAMYWSELAAEIVKIRIQLVTSIPFEKGVASKRQRRGHSRVDDGREDLDTGRDDGDDEWRGRGTTTGTLLGGLGEQGRVGVNNHTDDECTEDVEEQDSVKGLSDGRWDGLSRVLRRQVISPHPGIIKQRRDIDIPWLHRR